MSDDDPASKTEDPTEKRKSQALQKGQVPKSQELSNAFSMVAAAIVVLILAQFFMDDIKIALVNFLESPAQMEFSGTAVTRRIMAAIRDIAIALALPIAVIVALIFVGERVQHPFLWTTEKMKPKLSKLNIVKNFQQKFSMQALIDLGKTFLKLSVLLPAIYIVVLPLMDNLPETVTYDPFQVMEFIWIILLRIMLIAIIFTVVIGIIDYLYQKQKNEKQLRMTKQEVKDEHKQAEGDPEVKKRIAKLRFQRARERMMQAVGLSDVVVTNPTHFACALKYDAETMAAPMLVAKGADEVALRIRDMAEEHQVPIVENPPLARALFATVEIDEPIKPEHYQAVAEVISFVMKQRGSLRSAQLNPGAGRGTSAAE